MIIIIFGSPGVGKGTQASILSKKLNIPHFSMGDIFRQMIQQDNKDPLSQKFQKYINSGTLIPDELVCAITKKHLEQPSYKKGYILDGFPRNVNQADTLTQILKEQNKHINFILWLSAPKEELIKRLLNRQENRSDDSLEVIENRLKIYQQETRPLIEYYQKQGDFYEINGLGTITDISNNIFTLISQ